MPMSWKVYIPYNQNLSKKDLYKKVDYYIKRDHLIKEKFAPNNSSIHINCYEIG